MPSPATVSSIPAARRPRTLCLAVALALCEFAGVRAASAQDAQPAPPPAAAPTSAGPTAAAHVSTVNVVAERPVGRIDRQVYDVKNDANASNASAADTLNNVPSVAVDPDGTVSLRGNTNVQILVDGKPSAMLQGEGRGNVLQAMPAEDIDSVEVINNPGAEFGNEGGGGPILNLVMKRTRRPGGFGVANVNKGTDGRYNAALNGSYNTGRWGVQGGVNVRHDGRNMEGTTTRDRIDPATGADQHSRQVSTSTGLNDSAGLRGQLSYNVGQDDTLEASVGYLKRGNDSQGLDHYQVLNPDGTTNTDYFRSTQRSGGNHNAQWGVRWDHKGERLGELFRMDLRVSTNDNDNDTVFANRYLVAPGSSLAGGTSVQDVANTNRIVDYTGDYERPFDDGAVLKLGYKISENDSGFDTRYADVDPVTGMQLTNMRRTNTFNVGEHDAALYGSYQFKLSARWMGLMGLRAEYTHMTLAQATSGTQDSNRYLNWIPSAYATYKLDDGSNLRFSYSHRIRRPNANDLNPFIVYKDELNESAGNPHLKPVQTDSFEIGWETKLGKLDTALRGFYRADTDMIRSRQTALGNEVLLTTLENGGANRSGGVEFTLNGKLTPQISVNTSGILAVTEQQQVDLTGIETTRTASSLSLRGRLNYDLTPQDHLQLQVNARGKTLAGSGYAQPVTSADLTYRRDLTQALSLLVRVSDVFSSQKMETITNTAFLKEDALRRFDGRIAYVGLSWRFGGVQGMGRRERPDGDGPPPGMPPGGPGGSGGPGGGFGGGGFGGGPGM
jgi:outer membrane receptor protein involved in Fe transport